MNDTNGKQVAADRLADVLRGKINRGDWLIGSRVPTIRQLAQDHGVSVNTAMYAYRHLEREGLVERRPHGGAVVAGMPESDPSASVSTGRAGQIAVIGPMGPRTDYALRDEWWIRILMAAEEALLESGDCTLVRAGSMVPDRDRAIEQIAEQVRGLRGQLSGILIPNANTMAHVRLIALCDELSLPWITINRPFPQLLENFVCGNNLLSGMLAGRCFLELGIDRVLFLCGEMHYLSKRETLSGMAQAYWMAGRQTDGIRTACCHRYDEQHGYQGMDAYLREHDPPEAIFSPTDMIAVGAMRACEAHGLSVPQDINVLGGTGLDLAECVSPSLATITQPMREIGREAARMLLHLVRTGRKRITGRMFAPTLTVRDSMALDAEPAKRIVESLDAGSMDRIIAAGDGLGDTGD